MYTVAVCLLISNINLSVSELDCEFHMPWFVGESTSLVCKFFVCYALCIRNKCYYVLPFTSQGKDGFCLAVSPCFPVASPTHSIKDYLQVVTGLIMTELWWAELWWDLLVLCHISGWLSKCINSTIPNASWNVAVNTPLKLKYSC